MSKLPLHFLYATASLCLAVPARSAELPPDLRAAMTFQVTFDDGLDAAFAKGDARLYSSKSFDRKEIDSKTTTASIERVADSQRSGRALKFTGPNKTFLFYRVKDNMSYRSDGPWSGSVSYFLKVDPDKDLAKEYVDPLQITEKAYNDAAFWNDFTKDDSPRKFRLGVLPDLKHWNPKGDIDFDKLPDAEKPAVVVTDPPFKGQWVHVLIVFENFNTGRTDGKARLYLDGKLAGEVAGRNQKYSWDPEKAVIFIGINYGGLMDDLMIFDRAVTADEVRVLSEFGRKSPEK